MKRVAVFLICFFIPLSLYGKDEVLLKVDSKGHKGIIRDIAVTNDKEYIISASDDKTIRVWNAVTGKEERKILGEIGPGSIGMIYTIALSNDNKLLASAGYLNSPADTRYGRIRLYDFDSGEIVQILDSHTNVVQDVNFNEDGSFLVSSSSDKTLKLWKKSEGHYDLNKTIKDHTKTVNEVVFLKGEKSDFFVSVSDDKSIILHNLYNNKIKRFVADIGLDYVAASDKYIAACGDDKSVLIFDSNLNLIKKIITITDPEGVCFSPNGKYLLTGASDSPRECIIYDSVNDFKKITAFKGHTNLTMAVEFLNDYTAVTGGGSATEVRIWNIFSGENLKVMKGKGAVVWGVGVGDDKIAYGNKFDASSTWRQHQSSLKKVFDLNSFTISTPEKVSGFKRLSQQFHSYTLAHSRGKINRSIDGCLKIKNGDNVIAEIERNTTNGVNHSCYGFTDRGLVISGGSSGHLKAYDLNGRLVGEFIGHLGQIWALGSKDNILISGSYDQTIKLWNLNEIDFSAKTAKKIEPYLNLFFSTDNEWVAWSKSGYYTSSINGDEFVGFHVNRGAYKSAEFYPSERFFKTYYKPDLIANIVKLGSEEKGIAYTEKRKKVIVADSHNILPPKIILNSPKNIETGSEKVAIDFYVDPNSENEVTAVKLFLNGRELSERALKRTTNNGSLIRFQKEVVVDEDKNIIKIIAENQFSKSNPVYVNVDYKRVIKEDIFKPALYLLSIGVSDYKDKTLKLDYAAKDASSIIDIFSMQKGGIYKDVKSRLLQNEEATRINILKGISWLSKEATQKDLAIIFIAGHGINDDFSGFYFLPYDADREFLSGTSVEWTKFDNLVKNLPSKVILMADSCHSGNIAGGNRRSADITGALKDLMSAGTGQVIMTATTGGSYAYENPGWGHGAFTKALNDGLKLGYADFDKNNMITIKELDFYVTSRVKELTKGKQKPTTIIPRSVPDFPLLMKP